MSADLLRRAAAELREHAEAATEGPWTVDGDIQAVRAKNNVTIAYDDETEMGDGQYIALLHPPVALAIAAQLDATADYWDYSYDTQTVDGLDPATSTSLILARAVLREQS